ncbi:carboxypeptidase-like regulatory domain-containing protein [Bacteroidales bacterium MB20-C3-3]|nr:carboxypeptidase-like regulatory domain-containing protein [Bacteroidales bacterium MB20-C3-3]
MKAKTLFIKLRGMALATLLASLFAGACTKVDEPIPIPDPDPATYTIKGEVYNNNTGLAISGVAVKIGTLTGTTDNAGKFQFANLTTAGKYTIELTKTGFMPVTVSLEFPAGRPNEAHIFTVSAMMVPYVPGGAFISPSTGGTLFIEGGATDANLVMAPNTVAKDESGATIKTSFQIQAVQTNDPGVGTDNNIPFKVFNFGPDGYTFSPPLQLKVDNPLINYYFSNIVLQYFKNNAWETQSTPVTYDPVSNDYVTSISHFSKYRLTFQDILKSSYSVAGLKVYDSLKINRGLTNATWSNWKYQKKSGWVFSEPLETTLTNLGYTGSDKDLLVLYINGVANMLTYGLSSGTSFALSDETALNQKNIPSMTMLFVKGEQTFKTIDFTITLYDRRKEKFTFIPIKIIEAGSVVLTFTPEAYDNHAHGKYYNHDSGLGGGGSI